jgi:alpha-N-arabinofuranosidase
MANIAQMVNVLQAMVLTDDKKMVLTPTYFVFMLYMVHHDATLLPTQLQSPEYVFENNKLPAMNVSASRDKSGKIHVTLCNIDTAKPITLEASLQGTKAGKISGQILTAEAINSHNTFDKPDVVKPEDFNDAKPTDTGFTATVPAKSVVMLEITG